MMGSQKVALLGEEESKATISRIIKQTALDSNDDGALRTRTIELLSEAEADVSKRSYLIDQATLSGLMSTLQDLSKYLRSSCGDVDVASPKLQAIADCAMVYFHRIIRATISIVREGVNYEKVIMDMIAQQTCQSSMALEAKQLFDFFQYLHATNRVHLKFAQTARLVADLILLENALSDSKEKFASFDDLAEYLVVDSREIVKACCSAISSAMEGEKGGDNKTVSMSERPEACITYQCDACLVFPITERRYTLGQEDEDIDIDLCKKCYDRGTAYARNHDDNEPLIINGRSLSVENEDMTCGKIWSMTSMPISSVQIENAKKAGLLNNMSGPSKESTPAKAEGSPGPGAPGSQQELFTQLLGVVASSLDANKVDVNAVPSMQVIQLLVNLVLDSQSKKSSNLKDTRGKELVAAFTKFMPSLVIACHSNFSKHSSKLILR